MLKYQKKKFQIPKKELLKFMKNIWKFWEISGKSQILHKNAVFKTLALVFLTTNNPIFLFTLKKWSNF